MSMSQTCELETGESLEDRVNKKHVPWITNKYVKPLKGTIFQEHYIGDKENSPNCFTKSSSIKRL